MVAKGSATVILNDIELTRWASKHVRPFDPRCVNPASIDLKLSNKIRFTRWYWRPGFWRIAHKLALPKWTEPRRFERVLLRPGQFALCASLETTRIPDDCAAALFSKSSTGRRGIEHLHAGLGDPGFGDNERGGATWTWEIVNAAPWGNVLTAGERLMQLVLWRMVAPPSKTYRETGRYNEQSEPTPAKEQKCFT